MKIGYAMYSARDLTTDRTSMRRALGELAGMGYEGVEFFQYCGIAPEELKKMLEELGLEAIAAHVHKPRWDADAAGEIEYAARAGIPRLVYPWIAPEDRTEAFYGALPETLGKLAGLCRERGVSLLYHNHDFEFERREKGRMIDVLLEENTDCGFELDTFWAHYAGCDPVEAMKKWKDRIPAVHVKGCRDEKTDPPSFCAVGTGSLDNTAVIRAAAEQGKEWLIVELDNSPGDPLESAGESLRNIRKVLI